MMTPNSFDSSLSTLHHPSINTAVLALYDVLYHRRNLGGTRGTGSTTFWTEGYHTLTSQNKNVKNLLSPAVSRGDLRRSKLFLAASMDSAGRAHVTLPDPRVG